MAVGTGSASNTTTHLRLASTEKDFPIEFILMFNPKRGDFKKALKRGEFESILTDTQKDELKKIKEEGRKKFERNHKRPMFGMPPKQGFGCPKRPPIELPVEKPVPVEK